MLPSQGYDLRVNRTREVSQYHGRSRSILISTGLHVLAVVGLWLTPGSVLREVAQSTHQRLFIPIVTEAPH